MTMFEDLNKYCLFEILNQIKRNCEINDNPNKLNIVTYSDLINFALTCEWFRSVFLEWDPYLFDNLGIEQTYLSNSKVVIVNFGLIQKGSIKSTTKDKDTFWKMYIDAVKTNRRMEKIVFKNSPKIYDDNHGEIMNMILSAVENNRRLKTLHIYIEGYFLERFPKLRYITDLRLSTKINVEKLIDYCQINPNLVRLKLMNNEIYGKLSDIVPYCQHLKELSFAIKSDAHDTEYKDIANLPQLEKLRIAGVAESGSVKVLMKSLVKKEPCTLKVLEIDEAPIDYEDIAEVCRLSSLKEFSCRFRNLSDFKLVILIQKSEKKIILHFQNEMDAAKIAFLGNLTNFSSISIFGNPMFGSMKPLLKKFASQESSILTTLSFKVNPERVLCTFNNEEILQMLQIKSLTNINILYKDDRPIELPEQLPSLKELTIQLQDDYNSGSLKNLFKAFSQQNPCMLTHLTIKGSSITLDEVSEIKNIQSLLELTCGFKDIEDISHLAQLENLDLLWIASDHHDQHGLSEAIVKFVEATGGRVNIYQTSINVDKNTITLTIQISEDIDTDGLVPLVRLPNVCNLIIHGVNKHDALTPLFSAYANDKSTVLQSICAADLKVLSRNEIVQISQIKTLNYLDCGFLKTNSMRCLRFLPKLENLRIPSKHDLRNISSEVLDVLNGCSNEISVLRESREITFNKALKRLTISNSSYTEEVLDAQEYAPLAELPQLRSLHIAGRHELGTLKDLFGALAAKQSETLDEIVMKKERSTKEMGSINLEDTLKLTQILSLRRLVCSVEDVASMEHLAKLANLQDLKLEQYPKDSLIGFFNKSFAQESPKLKSLALRGNPLTPEEIAHVSRIYTLSRLVCGFSCDLNTELFVKLEQLEELTIIPEERNIISTLLSSLPKGLRQLKIENESVSKQEIEIISNMKSLHSLSCELADVESLELLRSLPELNELSLKLVNYDIKGIEVLAHLKNLTSLKIVSPEVGSLQSLLKEFSLNETSILECLDILENDVDSSETEFIAKMKSLKRLMCGFSEDDNFKCLTELRNLEELELTSYVYLDEISTIMLNILRNCTNLKLINCHYGNRFVSAEFISEALEILKTVRNPEHQDALHLNIPYFNATPQQIAILDDKYLIVSRFAPEV